MSLTVDEKGRCFSNVNCRLPYELKTEARQQGLKFSCILEQAVRAELGKLEAK